VVEYKSNQEDLQKLREGMDLKQEVKKKKKKVMKNVDDFDISKFDYSKAPLENSGVIELINKKID